MLSCDYMQRGDISVHTMERPSPPYRSGEKFDQFAPVSGKPVGMLVVGQEFSQPTERTTIAYVNIGNAQGVKVGDYLRIFRYQGSLAETAPNTKGYRTRSMVSAAPPQDMNGTICRARFWEKES